jgi:hypothetical protein
MVMSKRLVFGIILCFDFDEKFDAWLAQSQLTVSQMATAWETLG